MDKSRTEILIGKEGLEKLEKKRVTVVGIGGVGGYATIMLARAGIKHFTLIDFDRVSPSNLNRQVVAYKSTIGRFKTEVMQEMIKDIDEEIEVKVFSERLTKKNISSLIKDTDIVVDAIDSVKDKIELIAYCKQNNIYILSAMGAGNRYDIPKFQLMDIYKTHDDGLAKCVRKALRERNIDSLDVVISTSPASISGQIIGSISYYPAMSGCYISAVIINKILKEEL